MGLSIQAAVLLLALGCGDDEATTGSGGEGGAGQGGATTSGGGEGGGGATTSGGGEGGEGGSGPSDAELCEATGGFWNGNACECAQDGASLHFVFVPGEGCRMPPDDALVASLTEHGAGRLLVDFLPAAGEAAYVIDRPGAVDDVKRYATDAELVAALETFGWPETFSSLDACPGPLQSGELPTVNCDDDTGMSPPGCHYLDVLGDDRAATLMETLNGLDLGDFSQAEIDDARASGDFVLKLFIDSRHGVTFGFRYSSGAFRLALIDLSRYGCGA
jgi:hypothetical protein